MKKSMIGRPSEESMINSLYVNKMIYKKGVIQAETNLILASHVFKSIIDDREVPFKMKNRVILKLNLGKHKF